jgi:hypothetical protein
MPHADGFSKRFSHTELSITWSLPMTCWCEHQLNFLQARIGFGQVLHAACNEGTTLEVATTITEDDQPLETIAISQAVICH